jgi:hypothetical protein
MIKREQLGESRSKKTWSVHQPPLDENQLARDILHRIATVLQIGPKYHPINMASNKF